MKPPRILIKIFALWLTLAIALPNPVLALRQSGLEENSAKSRVVDRLRQTSAGLEEKFWINDRKVSADALARAMEKIPGFSELRPRDRRKAAGHILNIRKQGIFQSAEDFVQLVLASSDKKRKSLGLSPNRIQLLARSLDYRLPVGLGRRDLFHRTAAGLAAVVLGVSVPLAWHRWGPVTIPPEFLEKGYLTAVLGRLLHDSDHPDIRSEQATLLMTAALLRAKPAFITDQRTLTVLYPGSGSHVTPLEIATLLISQKRIDSAQYIFTEIDERKLSDLEQHLLLLRRAGLFDSVSKSEQPFDEGKEVVFQITFQGKPITLLFALRRSGKQFWRPEYLQRANLIYSHDASPGDPTFYAQLLEDFYGDGEDHGPLFLMGEDQRKHGLFAKNVLPSGVETTEFGQFSPDLLGKVTSVPFGYGHRSILPREKDLGQDERNHDERGDYIFHQAHLVEFDGSFLRSLSGLKHQPYKTLADLSAVSAGWPVAPDYFHYNAFRFQDPKQWEGSLQQSVEEMMEGPLSDQPERQAHLLLALYSIHRSFYMGAMAHSHLNLQDEFIPFFRGEPEGRWLEKHLIPVMKFVPRWVGYSQKHSTAQSKWMSDLAEFLMAAVRGIPDDQLDWNSGIRDWVYVNTLSYQVELIALLKSPEGFLGYMKTEPEFVFETIREMGRFGFSRSLESMQKALEKLPDHPAVPASQRAALREEVRRTLEKTRSMEKERQPRESSAGLEEIPEPTVGQLEQWVETVAPEHRLYGWLKEIPETEAHSVLETVARGYLEFGRHMRWTAERVVQGRAGIHILHKPDGAVTDVEKEVQETLNRLIGQFDSMSGIGEEGSVHVPGARYTVLSDPVDGTANYIRPRSDPLANRYLSTLTVLYTDSSGRMHPVLTLVVAPEYPHGGKENLWLVAGLGIDGVLVNGQPILGPVQRPLSQMAASYAVLGAEGKENYDAETAPFNEAYRKALEQAGVKEIQIDPDNLPTYVIPSSVADPALPGLHLVGSASLWDTLPGIHFIRALEGGEVFRMDVEPPVPLQLGPELLDQKAPPLLYSASSGNAQELFQYYKPPAAGVEEPHRVPFQLSELVRWSNTDNREWVVDVKTLPKGLLRDFIGWLNELEIDDVVVVGGLIRDSLLGYPPKDVDFATKVVLPPKLEKQFEKDAELLTPIFLDREYKLRRRADQVLYRVAKKMRISPRQLLQLREKFRGEGLEYSFSTMVIGSHLIDVGRQSTYTVNQIAMDRHGHVYMPSHGLGFLHLQERVIAIGPSHGEGPQPRMHLKAVLQGIRFEHQYGFQIEPATMDLLTAAAREPLPVRSSKLRRIWWTARNSFLELRQALADSSLAGAHLRAARRLVVGTIWDSWMEDIPVRWLNSFIDAVPDPRVALAELESLGALEKLRQLGVNVDQVVRLRSKIEVKKLSPAGVEEIIDFINPRGEKIIAAVMKPAGQGPFPVALVFHGLTGNKEEKHIRKLAEALTEAGYLTVRPDFRNNRQPGQDRTDPQFNQSNGELPSYSLDGVLEDVATVVEQLSAKVPEADLLKVALAGHSYGGWTARRVAALSFQGDPRFARLKVQAVADLSGVIHPRATLLRTLMNLQGVDLSGANEMLAQWKIEGRFEPFENQRYWLGGWEQYAAAGDLTAIPRDVPYLYFVGDQDDLVLAQGVDAEYGSAIYKNVTVSRPAKHFLETLERRGNAPVIWPHLKHAYAGPRVSSSAPPDVLEQTIARILQGIPPATGVEERIDKGKLWNQRPGFLRAADYFNGVVLKAPELKLEHWVELFRLFREEPEDKILTRLRARSLTGSEQAQWVQRRVMTPGWAHRPRNKILEEAVGIYQDVAVYKGLGQVGQFLEDLHGFNTVLPGTPKNHDERDPASGHHRLAWFLMNYFLIRNGYSPFYFASEEEYGEIKRKLRVLNSSVNGQGDFVELLLERVTPSPGTVSSPPLSTGVEERELGVRREELGVEAFFQKLKEAAPEGLTPVLVGTDLVRRYPQLKRLAAVLGSPLLLSTGNFEQDVTNLVERFDTRQVIFAGSPEQAARFKPAAAEMGIQLLSVITPEQREEFQAFLLTVLAESADVEESVVAAQDRFGDVLDAAAVLPSEV